MKPKHKIIVILLIITALLVAYEHKKNRRRVFSITSSPRSISFVAATSSPTTTLPNTNPVVTVPGIFKDKKPVVTIGVILPLTGAQAAHGHGIKEGLDLAATGINETDKFRIRVKLVYEDTASDAKNAPAAARKLINQDKATLLITGLSPTSLAVLPIAEEKRVVLFTMASLATSINSAGIFVFKNDDVSSKLGDGLARAAREAKTESTAILYATYDESTVEAKSAFAKTFTANGGTVTGEQGFAQDTTDFRLILGKLIPLNEGPASIAIFGLDRDCALATEQLRNLGYRGQLYGSACMDDPEIVAITKTNLEGAVFVSFNGIPSLKFSELVKSAYGHEPLRFSAEAFDGMKLMALALLRAYDGEHPITSENLRETLTHLTSYSGEVGQVTFDKDGNAARSVHVKTVRSGKIELVK